MAATAAGGAYGGALGGDATDADAALSEVVVGFALCFVAAGASFAFGAWAACAFAAVADAALAEVVVGFALGDLATAALDLG